MQFIQQFATNGYLNGTVLEKKKSEKRKDILSPYCI